MEMPAALLLDIYGKGRVIYGCRDLRHSGNYVKEASHQDINLSLSEFHRGPSNAKCQSGSGIIHANYNCPLGLFLGRKFLRSPVCGTNDWLRRLPLETGPPLMHIKTCGFIPDPHGLFAGRYNVTSFKGIVSLRQTPPLK